MSATRNAEAPSVPGEGRTREGYIVIADISGYTAFLTGTELEHAQSIIEELTGLIRARLAPPLRFVKLEGDAVLCYSDAHTIGEGERLVEVLEACYFAFSNLLFNMARATTCRCAACASIDSLDLKFIAHFGAYVVERDGSAEDIAGPDVILAHRLLKNAVTEATGASAYAFFTDACMQRLPTGFELPKHAETVEQFGETAGGVHDLASVAKAMREAQREYVTPEEADGGTTIAVRHPPAVVWQYVVDPVQRLRWACVLFNRDPDEAQANASGRAGVGAKTHCNHGPAEAFREITDWRPFDYYSARGIARFRGGVFGRRSFVETWELTPTDDGGTLLSWRLRFIDRSRVNIAAFKVSQVLFRRMMGRGVRNLHAAIAVDLAAAE